ncbi:MAG: BA14K family protein [Bradyrhizobium sp.]|uniref:BA14K family protein n=1 Tax=Bradyrhizobium sp. TaxID=376 RepID=UPI001C283F85|nr:BA14K family protein [Bradyrhizobium sp.]MBU6464427.1 BA14K family protein [Pseudomonadota bacterium]MDE2069111.1 BA14K family protein [Bradyrhizobium sp.]MDE2242740.1 BA14K family protein [Bradyrhizobium sp.]MDE2471360.1 BA14K family protein [Bradyrhizobium sp.]
MISLKVLSTAAVMTLALPIAMPTASFADPPHGAFQHSAGRSPAGGNFHPGGNFHQGGNARFSGGGHFHHGGHFGAGVAAGVAGAAIGGALASQAYYDGPDYYNAGPDYYDDQYYDDGGVVAAVPESGGGDVAYCMQTYRSYDPQSGTYLGYDGYRHPCP